MGTPNTHSQGLSTIMKTSFLALALLALLATSALARQTAKNGYSMTFDVPKDTWEYVDLSLAAGEFLNATDTSGYKVMIATDITELFTTQLWFGVDDVDQTDAAGEIDSGATGMGRGDRSGEGSAPGAGDYVLSIYATCDGCNDVTVELQMYLVDAGDALVPFMIQNNMLSASFEIDSGDVATLAYHDAVADDEIYINMFTDNDLNTVNVVYGIDMPLDADDSKYPSGSAQKGDFKTGALATEVGMNYYGVEGVDAVAGGINYAITTGINEEPTVAGSFTFPSVIAVAIAAVAAIFAL